MVSTSNCWSSSIVSPRNDLTSPQRNSMNRYQTVPKQQKYTAKMFEAEFPTEDACLEYVKERSFPGGMALCVNCKVERKHYRVSGRTSYACRACGNHIYPLAGTIFH